jgi:integrase
MENAAEVEKRAAGATETSQADVEGKLVEFAWWMKKQGYAEETIRGRVKLLKVLVKRGANLHDPESVKEVISKQSWSERRKELAVDAYTSFLKMVGGAWKPPRYRKVKTLPFIPTERELDLLIAACNKKTSTFLQLLKETGMRCGEAWRLRWEDVDVERRAICVTPEKGSEARVLKISEELAEMLGNLPRLGDRVFTGSLTGFRRNFQKQRARAARKLENPRILKITFHTFRHWKATVEYHRTKDIIHVMKLLGHRNINNTLVYITLEEALFQGGSDEFYSAVARSVEEARKLIEAGFKYVCDFDGIKLFRKRK